MNYFISNCYIYLFFLHVSYAYSTRLCLCLYIIDGPPAAQLFVSVRQLEIPFARYARARKGTGFQPEEVRQHRARAYEFIHEVLPRTFSPL